LLKDLNSEVSELNSIVKEFDDNYSDDPIEPETSKGSVFSKLFSFVGIGALLVVGSTFAANINLNSGQRVEFGQGISIVTSCDSQVTLTPRASFVNVSGSGSFYFSSFTLSNVDVVACNGVSFTLKAYGNTSPDPLTLFSTNNSAVINDSSTAFVVAANQSGLTLSDTSTTGAFTANFTSPVALASNVYKISIETAGKGNSSFASVTVSAFTFIEISAGWTDTCGIVTGGSVYCWGRNGYGQLGNGTTSGDSYGPVQVIGITNAIKISLGNSYACALLSSGTIKCWGIQGNGALGDGSGSNSNIPVSVSGIANVNSIGIGNGTNCAVVQAGTAYCWGYNWTGQVGDGTTSATVATPVQVSGLTAATQAIAGQNSSCALLSSGSVKCWGTGANGSLGNGQTYVGNNGESTPVSVSGISTATQIAKGDDYGCALLSGGSIKCWGFNSSGQLGDGTTTSRNTPVSVTGISAATQISARTSNTCALLQDGSIKCWGWYGSGMLGTVVASDSSSPVTIAGISNATAVVVGNSHTCAIISGGQVKCWGDNSYGQFGNGTTTSSATPS
jgi:alpha-tubulin suppressor-like RCC1 family protein